jgi:[lysine-biosynthesis-protein LysW]--L-2-aminoadipate ligase
LRTGEVARVLPLAQDWTRAGGEGQNGAHHPSCHGVHLLAPRLRVEERQLLASFAERGLDARLVDPQSLSLSMTEPPDTLPALAVDRGVATPESATLAALLAASGTAVVNRAATARLLADRLALLRHLIVADVPVPRTLVAFGQTAALDALRAIGYPALIMSPQVDPRLPDALVEDADTGEAVVEHRAVLGRERVALVQEYVAGQSVRLAVVGTEVLGADALPQPLVALGQRVVSRLGSGVYELELVEGHAGPVVVAAGNLVGFRALSETGIDVAGRIAGFALSQLSPEGAV